MPSPAPKPLLHNTQALMGEIPLNSIQANPETSIAQENPTTLTSYNLLEKTKRTIIVPGSPSIWTPPKLPARVVRDTGKYLNDAVRHIFPKCPLEPFFRALSITKPDFDPTTTDLITDRRNLRMLLSFVGGSRAEFRIDVEVAGATVMFSCWHKFERSFSRGHGREFEKRVTNVPESVAGSVTHNRAVGYTFGGLSMVVRFEVDGFIDGTLPEPASASTAQDLGLYEGPEHALTESGGYRTPTGFTVSVRGLLVPPQRIIEIKSGTRGKDLSEYAMDQMWFSQTPILCGGHYTGDGVFSDITVQDKVREGGLAAWEKDNKEKLRKLVRVLERIREVVRSAPGGKCVIVHPEGSGVLRVYSVADRDAQGLPGDILARWDT